MAWITLSEADLRERLSSIEINTYKALLLAGGDTDHTAGTLATVSNAVRGYVAGCQQNTLGEAGTIPEELKDAALDLTVPKIMQRCAGKMVDPDGARKKAADDAKALLRDVARCLYAVAQPVIATTEEGPSFTPSFHGRDPALGRELEDGI